MDRKVRVAVTTEQGVLLDLVTITIPANHTEIHIISAKPDQEVVGADVSLSIGASPRKASRTTRTGDVKKS